MAYSPIPEYQVFPFWPKVGCKERLKTMTNIIIAKDGSEQRISLRSEPRQIFEFSIYLDNRPYMALLDSMLFTWQKLYWMIPIWPEKTLLTNTLSAGANEVLFDTAYADYRDDTKAILWSSPTKFEVLEIDTVSADRLTLSEATTTTFTDPYFVMPLRLAQLVTPVTYAQENRMEGTRDFTFQVLDNTRLDGHIEDVTYNSIEVVTTPSLLGEGEKSQSDANLSTQDYGMGRFDFFSDSTYNILSRSYQKRNLTKEECWNFRLWLHSFYGMQNVKWFPTFRDDLTLINPIGSSDTTFEIENIGLTVNVGLNNLRKYLAFVPVSGTPLYREITGLSELSNGNEQVTIDSSLGQTVAITDMICFLEKCRLASDEVEIEWTSGNENECTITLVSVVA
jgi:hypothetical protein